MPLTEKGNKIMKSMMKTYCGDDATEPCKKAETVFYASKNKGNITGVDLTESIGDFINSLKREDTKVFIEDVIMKGYKACFEDAAGASFLIEEDELGEDLANTTPDTPEETDEVMTELEQKSGETTEKLEQLKNEQVEAQRKLTDVEEIKTELVDITKGDDTIA